MPSKDVKTIPTVDYSQALNPQTKPQFLEDLRDALFHHGFFYLSNSVDSQTFHAIKKQSLDFFEIPLEEKKAVAMVNGKHFLGYNGLGDEITAKNVDWREQVEFATELPEPIVESEEDLYKNIEGPNMWPSAEHLPEFKPVVSNYIQTLSLLSRQLTRLIEECLGVGSGSLEKFFKEVQQAKLKIIKYPDLLSLQDDVKKVEEEFKDTGFETQKSQGVGEHRDNDFLTLIYQGSHHNSLQVKDFSGEWTDVPPVDDTLVFAVGMTLEFITQGVCISTVHRVLTPTPGEGDRLSVSFFQTINIDSKKETIDVSEDSKVLVKERDSKRSLNKIGFQFQVDENRPVGYSVFLNRLKSHPKVAEKYYPKQHAWIQEQMAKAENV